MPDWPASARRHRFALVLLAGLLLVACGGTAQPSPSPTPAQSSPTPTPQPLVAVLQTGSPDYVLRLVTLQGQEVARTLVSKNVAIAGTGGDEVGFVDRGKMQALRRDGQVLQLGTMQGWKGGRVVLSPDGQHWMWTTYNQESAGTVHSFLYLDDSLVADASEPAGRWLEPVAWTARGVVLEQAMLGIGGYDPYDLVTGPTMLIQPQQQTPGSAPTGQQLTPQTCLYADLASDGTIACRTPGPNPQTTTALQILPAGGTPFSVALPAPRFAAAGAISLLPTQKRTEAPQEAVISGATLAGANAGGQGEVYETDLVNLQTHTLSPFSTGGLRPGAGSWAWLSPTQLICYRPAGAAGGAPGIFIAGPSGPPQQITATGTPVGVIDAGSASSPSPSPSGSPSAGPSPSGSASPSPTTNPL